MIAAPRDDRALLALKRLRHNNDLHDLLVHWLRAEQFDNERAMTWETDDTTLRMRQGVAQALAVIFEVCERTPTPQADTGNGLPHRRTPHRLPKGNTIT